MSREDEFALDQFNQHWRSSPAYADIMRQLGIDPSRPMRLSDQQRKRVVQMARALGAEIPEGLEIDPAGNWNQNEGFGVQLKKWGPIAGAAALAAFGIPGVMPGLLTGGGAAAGGAAGASSGGTAASIAGAAGAAATGGGFWSSVGNFLAGPVGSQLIGAGADIAGNVLQNRAAERAADAQLQATREALDFERGVYEDDKRFFQPYEQLGQQSVARLSDMVNQPAPAPKTADQIFTSGQIGARPAPPPMPSPTATQPSLSMMLQRPEPTPMAGGLPPPRAPVLLAPDGNAVQPGAMDPAMEERIRRIRAGSQPTLSLMRRTV